MEFAENLKNLREKAGLSQEELADKMDVSRQSVSKWETGEAYPKMEHIFALTDILDCRLGDLVGEEAPETESPEIKAPEPKTHYPHSTKNEDHAKYNRTWFINELAKNTGEPIEKCIELDEILESTFWWGKRGRENLRTKITALGYTDSQADQIRSAAIKIISAALKDRLRHPFQY